MSDNASLEASRANARALGVPGFRRAKQEAPEPEKVESAPLSIDPALARTIRAFGVPGMRREVYEEPAKPTPVPAPAAKPPVAVKPTIVPAAKPTPTPPRSIAAPGGTSLAARLAGRRFDLKMERGGLGHIIMDGASVFSSRDPAGQLQTLLRSHRINGAVELRLIRSDLSTESEVIDATDAAAFERIREELSAGRKGPKPNAGKVAAVTATPTIPAPLLARETEINAAWETGESTASVAKRYGMSSEAVLEIVRRQRRIEEAR